MIQPSSVRAPRSMPRARRPVPPFVCGALCGLLIAPGCGAPVSPAAPRPAAESAAIIGGVNDPQDPGVVLLVGRSAQSLSLCTAEVLSPHVVLTAAHCVNPAVIGKGVTFQIFLGSDFNNKAQAANAANFVKVASTHFDARFNINDLQGGHDVAVVITAAPLAIPPLPLNRAGLDANDQGAAVRLVGFGTSRGNDQNGVTAGTRRQTTTQLNSFDNLLLEFVDPQHLTCEGDSGGPAFLTKNGVEVIAGITSFGDQGCQHYGYDTRVDAYLSFIDPYIAANDPGQGMNPQPTVDLGSAGGPDLARSGAADLAAGGAGLRLDGGASGGPGTGAVGDACKAHADCRSGTCAFTGTAAGYCTARCTPGGSDCPAGLTCGQIDGASYCVEPSPGGGGCRAAGPLAQARGATPAASWVLLLVAIGRLRRRRRRGC